MKQTWIQFILSFLVFNMEGFFFAYSDHARRVEMVESKKQKNDHQGAFILFSLNHPMYRYVRKLEGSFGKEISQFQNF